MCTNPIFLPNLGGIPIPCGKCLECALTYSRLWTGRCMDEARLHEHNCIITLTYANAPTALCKRDFQLFMKRLRKRIAPLKIRFYGCGEYGGKNNRPHFHVIIFGWAPSDCSFFFSRNGINFYKSDFVSEVWQHGYILVSECSEKAVKYATKYLTKLDKRPHDVPPFSIMSRRPGIGAGSVNASMAITGEIFRNGKSYQIPRFYLDKLEKLGYTVYVIKARREFVARQRSDDYLIPDKLRKQKVIGEHRLKQLSGK